ncbi:hypothetical protein GCM10028818_05760 [Spirosoma horti]
MLSQDKQKKKNVDKGKKPSKEKKQHSGRFGVLKKEKEEEELLLKDRLKPLNSGEVLTVLAKPQVFEGPRVNIQSMIVQELEKLITKRLNSIENEEERVKAEEKLASAHFIGSIELTHSPTGNLQELIANAKLTDSLTKKFDTWGENRMTGHSLNKEDTLFDLVQAAGLERAIVENTLATMESAGQLDYLQKSGLFNDDWKVLIEVHYYRDRDRAQTGLHKDTLGQTLFVNLNFENDQEVAGPEYIINPNSNDEYDKILSKNLPASFVNHLGEIRRNFPEPDEFGASKIPMHGVVAFVDEAIHHKTPTLGHRQIAVSKVVEKLENEYPKQYADAKQAYQEYSLDKNLSTFSSCLKLINPKYARAWLTFWEKSLQPDAKFDRTELSKILPASDIDILIGGEGEWAKSGSPYYNQFGSAKSPTYTNRMVVTGKPQLKRQMSQMLLDGTAPNPAQGRRTFFRTWVRAIPTLNNQTHTVAISDIIKKNPKVKKAYNDFEGRFWFNKEKKFTDYLPDIYHPQADQWYDIMSKGKNARYYSAALHPVIKGTLK